MDAFQNTDPRIVPVQAGWRRLLACAGICWAFAVVPAGAVLLSGVNGKAVDFAGVKSATPAGLEAQVTVEGKLLMIPWSRFDLAKLATESPEIFAAYEKAKAGETVALNLGIFAVPAPGSADPKMVEKPVEKNLSPYDAEVEFSGKGGETGVLRLRAVTLLPPGGEPRAVLILANGDEGKSIRQFPTLSGGLWKNFQAKVPVALVAIDFETPQPGSHFGVDPAFIHPERGSGELIVESVGKLGLALKKENWEKLPLMVHGNGVLGAALAFNLAQWKPEKFIGITACKGAYYASPVTDDSLKVPVMFIKGLNDHQAADWKATQTLEEVYDANIGRMPNWLFAIEPNGDQREGPVSYRMAQEFLLEVWGARKPGEDGTVPAMDRSRGWIGSLETGQISRMENAETPLDPNHTWLPSAKFAQIWKDFLLGSLPPGEPGADPKP